MQFDGVYFSHCEEVHTFGRSKDDSLSFRHLRPPIFFPCQLLDSFKYGKVDTVQNQETLAGEKEGGQCLRRDRVGSPTSATSKAQSYHDDGGWRGSTGRG